MTPSSKATEMNSTVTMTSVTVRDKNPGDGSNLKKRVHIIFFGTIKWAQ
jgi:hypothetical protein